MNSEIAALIERLLKNRDFNGVKTTILYQLVDQVKENIKVCNEDSQYIRENDYLELRWDILKEIKQRADTHYIEKEVVVEKPQSILKSKPVLVKPVVHRLRSSTQLLSGKSQRSPPKRFLCNQMARSANLHAKDLDRYPVHVPEEVKNWAKTMIVSTKAVNINMKKTIRV